jgi:transposase-like protein
MLSGYPNDHDGRRNNSKSQIRDCRHCGGINVIRHGYTRKGKQRYRCRTCDRSFVQNPSSAAYDPARKEQILRAYHERASLRGISRIFGVSRNTLTRWLKKS